MSELRYETKFELIIVSNCVKNIIKGLGLIIKNTHLIWDLSNLDSDNNVDYNLNS